MNHVGIIQIARIEADANNTLPPDFGCPRFPPRRFHLQADEGVIKPNLKPFAQWRGLRILVPSCADKLKEILQALDDEIPKLVTKKKAPNYISSSSCLIRTPWRYYLPLA